MTNIYLITGALGSGKTTFLQNILNQINNKKIGVLINEFGSHGIDGSLIEQKNLEKIELSNGSIFCSCLKEKFVSNLIDLINLNLDLIFIESSGLSDPSAVNSLISFISNKCKNNFLYKGSICLIDAFYFKKQVDILTNIINQVKVSDTLIVNKRDLINNETFNALKENLKIINKNAVILETNFGNIPLKFIDNLSKNNSYSSNVESLEKRPKSFLINIDNNTLENCFDFLKALSKFAYRIKGFIKINNINFKVDSVMDTLYIERYAQNINTNITIIEKLDSNIIKELKKLTEEFNIKYKFNF